MARLQRYRNTLAAVAIAAIAATAGCSQQASMVASPVVLASGHTPAATASHGPQSRHSQAPVHARKTSAPRPGAAAPTVSSQRPAANNPAPPPPQYGTCTTSALNGECGPYADAQIEGLGSGNQDKIQVGNNVWSQITGASSTLYASSPGDWHVMASIPAGNTGVVSYPSVGVDFHLQNSGGTWYEQPLANFKTMVSSFSENMNSNSGTSAWAAYDIWLNGGKNEVMIQHDFANNGACTAAATATFGGSDGVPAQQWHLCQFGSEQVWKLGSSDSSKISERSGSVDVLSMLSWMESHGDLPQGSTIGLLGYGWEMASTGGTDENFQVNSFSITTS